MIKKARGVLNILNDVENLDVILKNRLDIPIAESKRLRNKKTEIHRSFLLGRDIEITNSLWYLFSLKEIFLDEIYKFDTSTSTPYIIICGANIGLEIIYFKNYYPNSRILGFEPDPLVFKKLVKNIETFECSNVDLRNKAVWQEASNVRFALKGISNNRTNLSVKDKKDEILLQIPAVRLKEYLNEKIDFLKIDIEGAEFEVLKDCKDSLVNVQNIFVEYHSMPGKKQHLAELLEILDKAGFRIYVKEAWNNLPAPYLFKHYKPFWDLQLNIFGYRP